MSEPTSMADYLTTTAQLHGEKTALVECDTGQTWSYQCLEEDAARLGQAFKDQGVHAGDRIVLHLPNSYHWVVAYHAIARIGAVVVPVNILLSPDELNFIIEDSGAKVIVVAPARAAAVDGDNRLVVVPTADARAPFSLFSDHRAEPETVADSALFTLGYTSGTTGRPKGVMLSHGNILNCYRETVKIHARTASDRALSGLPFAHVYGCTVMNATLLAGGIFLMMGRFDPTTTLELIASWHATNFEGVPTMYYQILERHRADEFDLHSLRMCTVGGQTMPKNKIDQVAKFFHTRLCEIWGMTEVGGPGMTHSPAWPARHGYIGKPLPGLQARIVGLESRSPVNIGEDGELQVRGTIVTSGYWRNPDATRRAIDADGWLSTGDVCTMTADGYFRVLDRCKDVIITAGYNIYPAEVERVISSHPMVAMAAVTSSPDEVKGEIPHAFIVPVSDADISEADIEALCRAELAPYKIPRLITFVKTLPLTSTGKISRKDLRHLIETAPESSADSRPRGG